MTALALPTYRPADAGRHRPGAAEPRRPATCCVALGADLDRSDLADTPRRVARAYAELLTPRPFDLTTFPNDEGYDELVLARDIPFALAVRAPPAAVPRRRPRRLHPRRAHPRAVEAGPGGRAVRPRPAGAGAADQAGRRLAAGAPRARRASVS